MEEVYLIRGASPLGLPDTLSRAPLRRRTPFAWLARAARSRDRRAHRRDRRHSKTHVAPVATPAARPVSLWKKSSCPPVLL